jgi:hypothetical protein
MPTVRRVDIDLDWLNCDGERVGDLDPRVDIRLDYGGELNYPPNQKHSPKSNQMTHNSPPHVTTPTLPPSLVPSKRHDPHSAPIPHQDQGESYYSSRDFVVGY